MNKRAKKQKAIIFVIVLILALIFVYPLFLIVMNSVKPLAQILTKPLSWPDVFQTENYVKAFKEVNVLHVMKNTAVCNDAQHGCMRQQRCKGNNRCSRRI